MAAASPCEHFAQCRAPPKFNAAVHKDECTKCFDNDLSPAGLNVCLTCFNGGCAGENRHDLNHQQLSGHNVVLNLKKTEEKVPRPSAEEIARLMAEGKKVDLSPQYSFQKSVRCLACNISFEVSENPEEGGALPANVLAIVDQVMQANSAGQQADLQAIADAGDELKPCPHTQGLEQVANPPQLAHKADSKCQNCELGQDLWICMTCGDLGCSRKNWDGSGGNDHAVLHNESSGHPLVLKSGTITAEGAADIWCYACNRMVVDEKLAEHLAHFGVQMSTQTKTAKTMNELSLDKDLAYKWSSMFEEPGVPAELVFGPGLCGLANLGQTCYMASVLQVLMHLPAFQNRYVKQGSAHLHECRSTNPAACWHCQVAKVAIAINSGAYSKIPDQEVLQLLAQQREQAKLRKAALSRGEDFPEAKEDEESMKALQQDLQPGVRPRMFKTLVAGEHPEFSTPRQQDALQFLQFFLEQLEQREQGQGLLELPSDVFGFQLERKLKCTECHKVRVTEEAASSLQLPIPITRRAETPEEIKEREKKEALERERQQKQAAAAAAAGEEAKEADQRAVKDGPVVRAEAVTLDQCLAKWCGEGQLEGFRCPECQKATTATTTYRMATYPSVLTLAMQRFTFDNWVPAKVDVDVLLPADQPIELDGLRAQGLQPGEQLLPEEAPKAPEANAELVNQLVAIGFSENRAKRACLSTKNAGVDAATEWIFARMDDPGLDDPIRPDEFAAEGGAAAPEDEVSAEALMMLTMLGIEEDRARFALKKHNNDADMAAQWAFGNPDAPLEEAGKKGAAQAGRRLGEAPVAGTPVKYRLRATVTHQGQSTSSGHYVAHLRLGDRWVHFNDSKVSVAEHPPIGAGYLYFFERV